MKKTILYPLRMVEGLFDRLLALAGAIILVQFPQFYAQYLQRLGGHLDEARRIVSEYIKAAASNQLSIQEYINIHLNSTDKVFISTGKIIQDAVERLEHLESSFLALKDATPWTKLWVFIREADPEIVRKTWSIFTPGIPTTLEAFIYALIGILLAWGIYRGIKGLIILAFRKLTAPKRELPVKPDLPL